LNGGWSTGAETKMQPSQVSIGHRKAGIAALVSRHAGREFTE